METQSLYCDRVPGSLLAVIYLKENVRPVGKYFPGHSRIFDLNPRLCNLAVQTIVVLKEWFLEVERDANLSRPTKAVKARGIDLAGCEVVLEHLEVRLCKPTKSQLAELAKPEIAALYEAIPDLPAETGTRRRWKQDTVLPEDLEGERMLLIRASFPQDRFGHDLLMHALRETAGQNPRAVGLAEILHHWPEALLQAPR